MSSVFNSLKSTIAPTLRNVASYVSTNRDLIAKPILGAVGSLAATGLTAGVPALIRHIANKNSSNASGSASSNRIRTGEIPNEPKYKEILQSMMIPSQATPVTNIIGSGIKKVRRRGAGIKTF